MIILGLDSATNACSVVLWRDGAVLARRSAVMRHGQAESLVPMVVAVMAEAGMTYDALERIAVTVGPGSFTGVRVGLATARGLGLAAGCPVHGVTTTEALAHAVPEAERQGHPILVLIDSRRSEPFHQIFSGDLTPLTPPSALPLEVAMREMPPGPFLVTGDGAAAWLPSLGERAHWIGTGGTCDAAILAAIAATRRPEAILPAEPLYIRPPDVTVPPPPAP
ncbi:MAG: tRNA (adenosine(37)-N6)-threonylcarbamoyltransferase complex dimerization subunit type 1 TsaB [Alphaproteobacteria bacterium]|nr:tRNA (adenosine(37)-N6)-threonylcarbamoyltransferase complex dimerization subunit type 1 TsaB [Alphaproteobacteria bacterium]